MMSIRQGNDYRQVCPFFVHKSGNFRIHLKNLNFKCDCNHMDSFELSLILQKFFYDGRTEPPGN
jgi:hypothetical protein